jgi:hypothetical protein
MPPSETSHTDLLTSEEVVERLAAKPSLRRAAVRCVLKAIRFGGFWRFRQSELDAWIEREATVDSAGDNDGQKAPVPERSTRVD